MSDRTFPIQATFKGGLTSIPWELIAPHNSQAMSNHGGQNLHRLAERGGLSAGEAVATIEGKDLRTKWKEWPDVFEGTVADNELRALVEKFNQINP